MVNTFGAADGLSAELYLSRFDHLKKIELQQLKTKGMKDRVEAIRKALSDFDQLKSEFATKGFPEYWKIRSFTNTQLKIMVKLCY